MRSGTGPRTRVCGSQKLPHEKTGEGGGLWVAKVLLLFRKRVRESTQGQQYVSF